MNNRIEMACDFQIHAAADERSTPTFELIAYTGSAIRQAWSRSPLVVDLQGLSASRPSIPILWSHEKSLDAVLGRSTEIVNDGQQLIIRGELVADGPIASRVIALSKAGVPMQASIGADPLSFQNIGQGSTVSVNGRDFAGPVSVVRSSDLRETSIVLFGADSATSAAIAAEASEVETMADEAKKTPEQPVTVAAEATASVAVEPKVEAAAPVSEPRKEIDVNEIKAELIRELKAELLSDLRASRPAAPAIHVAKPVENEKTVEAALCLAANLPGVDRSFDEQTLEAASKKARTIGLQEVIVNAARQNGYDGDSYKITGSNIRPILQAAFATHSISNVLSAAYGKFLLQGFTAVESVWDTISMIRPVSDFKQVTGIRVNGGFQFEEVGNSGELKSADASDEARSFGAKTYGRISTITRRDLINDDLGALSVVPQRLGRGAATKLNSVFWSEFESNNATYFAKKTAGAGNALSLDSLESAVAAYSKLTDPDGNPLAVSPSLLLVPAELEIPAAKIMSSNLLIGGSSVSPSANVLAGRYQVVMSRYLTSASTWWLAANPGDLNAMEVVFLNGNRNPTIEQAQADFDVLGIAVRGYFDFGVAKGESKACYRMATA